MQDLGGSLTHVPATAGRGTVLPPEGDSAPGPQAENILVDGERNIKLADFGFSMEFTDEKLSTFCGTVFYIAPDSLQLQAYEGPKVDVWSLGVILYNMVTGTLPFEGQNFWEVKRQILSGHFLVPDFLSLECAELLKKLMTLNASQRLSLEDILKDPWVNRGQEEELRPYCKLDPQVTE